MIQSSHAEECDRCGGLREDREKYRDIPIRGRVCTCEGSSDDEPSFTHWNPVIRSMNPTLVIGPRIK